MDILFTNSKLPSIHSESMKRCRSKASTNSYAKKKNFRQQFLKKHCCHRVDSTIREPSPIALLVGFGLENKRWLVRFPALPMFFPRIDDSHCDRIHASLTALRCFDNGYVGKQPVAWKKYCAEYWLKKTPGKHG